MRKFAASAPAGLCAFLLSLCFTSWLGEAQGSKHGKADLAAGKDLFLDHCAACHGMNGGGGRGPNLRRPRLEKAEDDDALRDVIKTGIAPGMPEGWYFTDEDLVNVSAYVRSLGRVAEEKVPGNAAHGAQIYAQQRCGVCHIVSGAGNGFGPELTGIGTLRGAAQLSETLRHPERTLPDDFLSVEATKASGEKVYGVRVNEDSFSIQLKDTSGRVYSLRKSELKELRKEHDKTPMPSYDSMPDAEVRDLVAYLASLRGQR